MIKIQLISNKLGTVDLSKVDPESLDKLEEQIKRSSTNEGVIYTFTTTLNFPKIGREFLKQAYLLDGIEALVVVNIFEYNPNSYNWFISSSGKVNFTGYSINEIYVAVNLDQFDFNITFTNLIAQDVSMSANIAQNGAVLDPLQTVNILLQPKSLLKEYLGTPTVGNDYSNTPPLTTIKTDLSIYGVYDTSNLQLAELDTSYGYSSFLSGDKNDVLPLFQYQALEAGTIDTVHLVGKMDLTLNLRRVTVLVNSWTSVTFQIKYYLLHRDSTGATINETNFYTTNFVCNGGASGSPSYDTPPFTTTNTLAFDQTLSAIDVNVGDTFLVYFEFHSTSMVATGGDTSWVYYSTGGLELVVDPTVNFVDIKQNTIYPATTVQGVMAYELMERLCQYYTGQKDCFRSTALGRTDTARAYAEDGPASTVAFSSGEFIRQLLNKQLFFNFQDCIQALASSFGLSWGFETLDDGTQLVIVEEISHFYDKNTKVLDLGEVPKVFTNVSTDKYTQIITAGFRDLKQIKQLNAVDEFNQGRQFATPLTQVTTTLDLTAGQISASGYEIENQRRQRDNTTNSPLDSDRFMICVLRDGAPMAGIQNWKNERAESFTDISNLYDPTTAYNLRVRPGKNLSRWSKVLAANVLYGSNKIIKFSSATGNYALICKGADDTVPINESSNLDLTGVSPIWVNEKYTFEWPLNRYQWQALKENQYGYIQFKDKGVICQGFIDTLSRNPTSKLVKFQLLKVYTGE